ncbi:transposase [Janthinobacterium fluminis]|uniref:Transposase n=1 Tax=Janthinobacterium fluminis TaxID=2987524 RepID=A0ABT5JZ34_9BURK|nr:transposase [Janthinobacterium fluminis]MDC8757983.1 transposase [Janthinobacterium fluminis]
MARLPRLILPAQPHYVVQRGNNGQFIFYDAADYVAFLGWLRTAAKTFKVAVHAYVLMPEQLHLLVSPADAGGLGQMMQWLGRYYVPYFNQKYQRSGTLWQGRYKTSLIDPENYLLSCSRYLEFTPVGAGLAARPLDYAWSSYAHHVGVRPDPIITDHPLYWALGNTPFDREAAYLRLTEQSLGADAVRTVEKAVLKGWPLGSEQFKTALEQRLKRQVLPAKRGRPFKTVEKIAAD